MSNNKMLIDATHPEETRVVVLRQGRVEEFDYESSARKLLRGNIYLAKVTRVEPSLQAAFVDYGGNRHGFLAFNEIHPDYYQIPVADRQALLDEEAAAEAAEEAAADAHAERMARRRQRHVPRQEQSASGYSDEPAGDEQVDDESHDDEDHRTETEDSGLAEPVISEDLPEPEALGGFEPSYDSEDQAPDLSSSGDMPPADAADAPHEIGLNDNEGLEVVPATEAEAEAVVQTGAEDALEELPSRPRRRPRSYKIQEVIKRRQIILVQVVKEERGNKGAALTTYLSLAGRYTVLMPNTARGGGISRKITNPQDRKRLKAIANALEVPEGMGLIIRTAGAARTQQEIKRDFEYLLRLWESVRDLTLLSTAPSLVYEEGDLIKRSIRDLYNKDVEEIVVAGEPAHREAREFMAMLMPSHAKNVILHADGEPLFTKHGIERQLNAMFSPYVTLRSGGYIVINQTEALVAVDVNSGKSTREFSIEETALQTNLEASDEVARQLKLRDLAGLIVIDFIDMEEKRNNRAVERRLKDALRFDRARIQLGHISHFGLMEMSRQRLRTGVLEGSTTQCPHCQGTGIIRSTESVALAVLRGLEDSLIAGHPSSLVATTTAQVALYILNNKRPYIAEMERRNGITIAVQASDKLQGANFTIDKVAGRVETARRPDRSAVNMDWGFEGETEAEASESEHDHDAGDHTGHEPADSGRDVQRGSSADRDRDRGDRDRNERDRESSDGSGRKRRRRRGQRGGERGERSERGAERNSRPDFRGGQDGRGEQPYVGRDGDHQSDGVTADRFDGDSPVRSNTEAPYNGNGTDGADDGQSPRDARGDGSRDDGRGGRRRRGRRGGRRGRGDRGERNGSRPETRGGDGAEGNGEGNLAAEFEQDLVAVERPEPLIESDYRPRSEPVFGPEPAAMAAPEPTASEPAPEPERRRPRHAATSSEPKIERVVVSSDQPVAEAAVEAASQPAKRGWWSRK